MNIIRNRKFDSVVSQIKSSACSYETDLLDKIQLEEFVQKNNFNYRLNSYHKFEIGDISRNTVINRDSKPKSRKKMIVKDRVKIKDSQLFTYDKENKSYTLGEVNPIFVGVVIALSSKFSLLNDSQKEEFLREIKYKMALDFEREGLYQKFNYKKMRFRKSEFQEYLLQNKPGSHKAFYRYLADYFEINILEITRMGKEFLNVYDSNRHTIIFNKNMKYIMCQYEGDYLVNHKYMSTNFNLDEITKVDTKNTFKSMKLAELQKLAVENNIEIKKQGKSGKINRTKKELIDDLKKLA